MTATITTVSDITTLRADADTMVLGHVRNNPAELAHTLADLLTPEQRHLLRLAGFETDQEVGMECGRARSAVHLMQAAGTAKKRKAAEKKAEDAAAKRRTESVVHEKAIAAAQQALAELERKEHEATVAAELMNDAVERLKSDRILPKYLVEDAAFARKRIKASALADKVRELESQLGPLLAAIAVDGTDRALDHAQANHPDAVEKTSHELSGTVEYKLIEAEWSAYVEWVTAELAKLQPEAAALRDKFEAELATGETARGHYVAMAG